MLIGEKYIISDENGDDIVGTLQTAIVNVAEKSSQGIYITEDGHTIIASTPLSDAELIAYKKHPDEFFGVPLEQGKKLDDNDQAGLFDFFLKFYKKTPKEKLLEFMNLHPDINNMKNLSQENLAVIYSEQMVHVALSKK